MADTKITGLTELAATPANNDWYVVADVSDTTMNASGTNKKLAATRVVHKDTSGNVAVTGNFSVGTATAGYPLHVSAASGVQAYINTTSGQYTQVTLGNAGVDKFSFGWDNSAGIGYIVCDSAAIYFNDGRVSIGGIIGDAWANVSFNTGWTNYGGGYQDAQYKKVGDIVFLRGHVKRTSGASTTIATMPSGYRPVGYAEFIVTSNAAFGQVDIASSGELFLAAGNVARVSLNGIWFSTI